MNNFVTRLVSLCIFILLHLPMTDSKETKITYHERPITDLKYNRDGDLLFVGSKDTTASVTRHHLLGTYSGHEGAINVIDINDKSTLLATGGADKKIIVWDVETGKKVNEYAVDSMVRSVSFYNDNLLYITDDSFNAVPKVGFISDNKKTEQKLPFVPTKGVIDYKHTNIIISDESGFLHKLDMELTIFDKLKAHNGKITNLKNSYCSSFFITSSSDCTSKIVDYDFNIIKTFVTEEKVNCSAIFRTNDKVISAGGMSAIDVTTTRSNSSFCVNFFDIVDASLKGSYSTHFGTINGVDVHPSCMKYASGGEDASISIVEFGNDLESVEWVVDSKQKQKLEC